MKKEKKRKLSYPTIEEKMAEHLQRKYQQKEKIGKMNK